jgi:23S rRNA (guanosine2251-2'-O)-methyltransferase
MNSKKTMSEIEASHAEMKSLATSREVVVVLDNIRSGLNVGNIFRSSDAFGVRKIYCCGYTATPPHREILKSALGSTETVAWEHYEDADSLLQNLRLQGFECLAIEQTSNSKLLNEWQSNSEKIAVIFGNEVDGVNQSLIDKSDVTIELPQVGVKHSINVSVCAGIVLYKLLFA